MKKLLGLVLLIAVVGGVPLAQSIEDSAVPPGINGADWIPLGVSAGFVVSKGDSSMGAASSVGTVRGYFMVRRSGAWLRIDSGPDYGVHPAMH